MLLILNGPLPFITVQCFLNTKDIMLHSGNRSLNHKCAKYLTFLTALEQINKDVSFEKGKFFFNI